ncbi:MAG: Murein DD-endopeptidase MepM [bacterium ADurb.BinA186]|nr:MAG: Murein DD-endopeptidase MepM [bacterium ADurb.BinA186]
MQINFRPVKYFWSFNLLYIILFALVIIAAGQFLVLTMKNERIEQLISENSSLKEKIGDVSEHIAQLNDSQDDIRLFQREIADALKAVNNLAAIKFINSTVKITDKKYSEKSKIKPILEPRAVLAQLDLSVDKSRFENSVLLTQALHLKNIFTKVPSLIPARGTTSSVFGFRKDPFDPKRITRHDGLDIVAPIGAPIYAPAEGVILQAGYHRDFGNRVEIKHPSGLISRFGHMKDLMVFKGQEVKRGQVIGSIGDTGKRCQGAHLHYEVQQGNKKLNPKHFMLSPPPKKDSLNI